MGNVLVQLGTTLHAKLVKATGKLGGGTEDGSVLVLRHVGAKSGKVRESPLMLLNHNGGFAIVASMGGAPGNPAWYHNLKANPDVEVVVDQETIPVRAREVEGDERAELWRLLVELSDRWDTYQSKTDRVLPIIALDRR